METIMRNSTERSILSAINAKFINNFLTQDTVSHSEIIHDDFLCIESNGSIVSREEYLKNWATDFYNSGYTSFRYTDEVIRIFGSMALVRAKTIYEKEVAGKTIEGYTIYTDTYIRENGKWQCVQVQITPVRL
ncbi:MAG: nuclear transport factor 2 family protein [Chitinophagaceae bacterium]